MRKILFSAILALILSSAWISTGCVSDKSSGNDTLVYADKIMKHIKQGKNININGKHIVGTLNFTKIFSPNKKLDVSAVYIPQEICFRNCIFHDSVIGFSDNSETRKTIYTVFERNVNFEACEFGSALVMRQNDFRGRFDFDISKVNGEADFAGSHFRNGVSFCQANFNGDASFVSCNFEGRANFFKVFFRNTALFQYVRFNDLTMFSDAHFYGGVDMSKMFAAATIDFANSKFSENIVVSNSQFLNDLRMIACTFSKSLTFINNTIYGSLSMHKSKLGARAVFTDNVFYMEPNFIDCAKSDSLELMQNSNKTVNMIVKQII